MLNTNYKFYPICDLVCDKIVNIDYGSFKIKIIPTKLLGKETQLYKIIIDKFKLTNTFIAIPNFSNKMKEISIIKNIISIIFMANCFCHDSSRNFEDPLMIHSLKFFTTKIGTFPIDEEFFEHRIFPYPEKKELFPPFLNKKLYLTDNKNDIIGGTKNSALHYFKKICIFLNKGCELSNKLDTAFNIMYELMYNKIDVNFFLLSCQILEVLMLKSEEGKKSKLANRCAALILDGHSVCEKEKLANKIAKLYKDRSDIIHEGKSYFDFYNENPDSLNFDVYFAKNLFIRVIETIIEKNLDSVEDIKNLTKSSLKNDNVEYYYPI